MDADAHKWSLRCENAKILLIDSVIRHNTVWYISVAQKLPEIWLETSKNIFWQKPDFVKIDEFSLLKLKKCKNCKIDTLMFLAISPAIFKLQRCTIPHFNPLN